MEEDNLIGQRIRDTRESLGLSLEELGDLVGVSAQSVQQWETGKTTPRTARMRKLAAVLGKAPTWIQYGVGSAAPSDIGDTLDLIQSEEFKTQTCAAYAKAMQAMIGMGWVSFKRSDITLGILADLFWSKLLEEYGLDPVNSEVKKPEQINLK